MTYLRFDAAGLPGAVGADGPNGTRQSDGRAGHIVYGPYFSAPAGSYSAGFYIKRKGLPVDLTFDFDICDGSIELAKRLVRQSDLFDDISTLVAVNFDLPEPTNRIEARIYIGSDINIEIQSLIVFNNTARVWGGL